MDFLESDFDKVSYLVSLLTSKATGLKADDNEYAILRREILSNATLSKMMPNFLRQHRDLDAFWGYIKPKFSTYAERRAYLSEQFTPALDTLEFGQPFRPQQNSVPNTQHISHVTIPDVVLQPTQNTVPRNKRKVFIVHGRDNEAKLEVSRYIESLGLEAIILHEQASLGMTIIEKIEHYSNDADFAIILYTACDKGRGVHESNREPKNRARQNVVFEHGYLISKLGRENVCSLVKGEIETPNDMSGVVYVQLDPYEGWKRAVAKELQSCGYILKNLI